MAAEGESAARREDFRGEIAMSPVAIADLGRTVRVLEDLLPEVAHAPLWESQFTSMVGVVQEEIRALGTTHAALSGATEPAARTATTLIGDAIAQLTSVTHEAAQVPARGFIPLGAIPVVSKSHDVRPATALLEGARQSLLGAQREIATTPGVTLLGSSFTREGADLVAAPAVADATNAWIQRDPSLVQRGIRALVASPLGARFRPTAVGAENIPAEGAFLLAPTHGSPGDIVHVYLSGHDRTIRTITLDSPRMHLFQHTGSFPMLRGEGKAEEALSVARGMLADGQPVAMYPEGRIIANDAISAPHNGIARLALESGKPVVPAASYGTKQGFTRVGESAVHHPNPVVVYGEPISFEGIPATRENVAAAREKIWAGTEQAYRQARELYHQSAGATTSIVTGAM